jgi:hypothetical protein
VGGEALVSVLRAASGDNHRRRWEGGASAVCHGGAFREQTWYFFLWASSGRKVG